MESAAKCEERGGHGKKWFSFENKNVRQRKFRTNEDDDEDEMLTRRFHVVANRATE